MSASMLGELAKRLVEGGYGPDTPAAIVYKATWPEEKTFVCTVGTLEKTAAENGINRTALIIVGEAVRFNGQFKGLQGAAGSGTPESGANAAGVTRSRLYDAGFSTGYRSAEKSDRKL